MVPLSHSNRKPVVWCRSKLDTGLEFAPLFSPRHAMCVWQGRRHPELRWISRAPRTRRGHSSWQHGSVSISEGTLYIQLPHPWLFLTSLRAFHLDNHANDQYYEIFYQSMTLVILWCTLKCTHPLDGCLKGAIYSSKQNEIKTSYLQKVRKKTSSSTKQCQEACHMKVEVVQRLVGSTDKVCKEKSKCVFNSQQHVQQWGSLST